MSHCYGSEWKRGITIYMRLYIGICFTFKCKVATLGLLWPGYKNSKFNINESVSLMRLSNGLDHQT